MTAIVLVPRDGLFLKDGREWASAAAGRAHSLGWPAPSTLLGALCTAHGRVQEAQKRRTLSGKEWLAVRQGMKLNMTLPVRRTLVTTDPRATVKRPWAADDRMWPVPADALFPKAETDDAKRVRRLDPVWSAVGTLGADENAAREALWRPVLDDKDKPDRRPDWWPDAAFLEWLVSRETERPRKELFVGNELERHTQAHVGIARASQAAEDGVLFAHDVVETISRDDGHKVCHQWGIACDYDAPGPRLTGRASVGGDRRVATVEETTGTLFAKPLEIAKAFGAGEVKGLRLIAVTPAAFENGWVPDGFSSDGQYYEGTIKGIAEVLRLRAACIERAAHVSGWDMEKRAPKKTTRLVPPGSVYFLTKVNESRFSSDEVDRLWFTKLGKLGDDGFGWFVPGVWFPKGLTS